jgi:hypothetical protein
VSASPQSRSPLDLASERRNRATQAPSRSGSSAVARTR